MTSILLILGVVTASSAAYESRYDHVDIESILNNRRMVSHYAACLLSAGPCPPQGLDLKRILPKALETNCARCTEKQKAIAYRTIKRLKKEYPKIWAQLVQMWDPDDVFVRRFEATFEKRITPPVVQVPTQTSVLLDRFGDNEDPAINNQASSPSSSTSSSTTIRTTPSTTRTTTTANTKPTSTNFVTLTRPPLAPPFSTVGAQLQATVSFGTNLVGGIVRSLGTLGTKVVESGTKLANVVFSAALGPQI